MENAGVRKKENNMNPTLSHFHRGVLITAAAILCLVYPVKQSAAADPVVSATVRVGLTPSFTDLAGIQFTLINDPGANNLQVSATNVNAAANTTIPLVNTLVINTTRVAWFNLPGIISGSTPIFEFKTFSIANGAYPRFTIDPLSTISLIDSTTASFSATAANFVVSTAYLTQGGITQYFLNSTNTGNGGGTVTSTPPGIACTGTCSAIYDAATQVTLIPTTNSDSFFSGWSGGGCSGTGSCQVAMNDETSVTATFDIHPPVNIGANYFSFIGNAYSTVAGSSAVINLRSVDLTESPVFNNPITVTLNGGLDGTFNSSIGFTRLHGALTITSGAVTFDKLIIM
ncbi:MAG: hypothetical protein HXX11_07960 [Desulfuromonadales bacterium]|nr:hypothetical protein [Desulfuromonadales bacterium]